MFADAFRPLKSGVVTSIEIIVQSLRSMGHSVKLFVPKDKMNMLHGTIMVSSLPLPSGHGFRLPVPYLKKLFSEVKNCDIVHVHHPGSLGWSAIYIAKKLKKPIVFTHHSFYENYDSYFPAKKVYRKTITRIVKKYCSFVDCVIAPSNDAANIIRKNCSSRIEVVPSGVILSEFKSDNFKSKKFRSSGSSDLTKLGIGLPNNSRLLLYAGRLSPEKNIEFILHSFRIITSKRSRQKSSDVWLGIIGEGKERKNLERLAESLGIKHRIVFFGALEHKDVIQLMSRADVFVFASKSETQGIVLIEALASGTPIVAVKAQGVREIVNSKVGFLVNSHAAFANAVGKILDNSRLKKSMSMAARKDAKHHSNVQFAKKLMHVYYSLLDRI